MFVRNKPTLIVYLPVTPLSIYNVSDEIIFNFRGSWISIVLGWPSEKEDWRLTLRSDLFLWVRRGKEEDQRLLETAS